MYFFSRKLFFFDHHAIPGENPKVSKRPERKVLFFSPGKKKRFKRFRTPCYSIPPRTTLFTVHTHPTPRLLSLWSILRSGVTLTPLYHSTRPTHMSDSEDDGSTSFEAVGLQSELLRGVVFSTPTRVQQQSLAAICRGADVVLCASSGSGKATAMAIGMLHQVDWSLMACQALILTSTREVAMHLSRTVCDIGTHLEPTAFCLAVVGGTSPADTVRLLRKQPRVVVGTPGRVHMFLEDGALLTEALSYFCLRDADEILERGFGENVEGVLRFVPQTAQKCVTTRYLPMEAQKIVKRMTTQPLILKIQPIETLCETSHFYCFGGVDKVVEVLEGLCALIVCVQHGAAVALCEELKERGVTAELVAPKRGESSISFSPAVRAVVSTAFNAGKVHHSRRRHVIFLDVPEPFLYRTVVSHPQRRTHKRLSICLLAHNIDRSVLTPLETLCGIPFTILPEDLSGHLGRERESGKY